MINRKSALKFCNEIELIENYDLAVNDKTQIWDCHHRLETHTSDGTERPKNAKLSKIELITLGLYYKRPASELIFIPHKEHLSLHNKGKTLTEEQRKKLSEVNKGKHHTKEVKQKISKTLSKKKAVYVKIIPTGIIMTTKEAAIYFSYCSSGKLKQYIKEYGHIRGVACEIIEK